MLSNKLKLGVLGGIVCAALLLGGCMGEEEKQGPQQAQQRPAAPAPFVSVQKKVMELTYEYPARVKSSGQVDVMARVPGTLLKKHFTEGEFVKKGTLLYTIDPREYKALADKARAQVAVAEATLKNARRNNDRVQSLFKEKAVSEQERDDALSTFEVASAQLNAAKSELNDVLIDLDYTSVEAPISGITGKKIQDVGDLVGSSSANGHLVTVTQLDPVYVEFSIPDSEIEKVRKVVEEGDAQVLFENNRAYSLKGKIDFMDSLINEESGTIAMRATFPNPEREVLPGQFVRIKLTGASERELFSIPQKAVMQSPQGSFVYVIKEGKATINPVKLGITQGTMWLIEGGLEDGMQVIVDNLMKIRPNAPVKPMDMAEMARAKQPGA